MDFRGFRATYKVKFLDSGAIAGNVVWVAPGTTGSVGAWSATFEPMQRAAMAGSDPVALAPEVKGAIAEEIKAQLAEEKAAAATAPKEQPAGDGVPPALDAGRRTFIVASELDVVAGRARRAAGGEECSLTQGDVIMRLTDTPDADGKVNVSVASGKRK